MNLKCITAALLTAAALTACNGDKLKQADARNAELQGDLQETLATQDSLFALLNDITDGMNQIKDLEQIVTTPANLGAESAGRKDQIRQDMAAIKQALEQRRQRLEELEKKLKESGASNATLQKTLANLRAQIESQDAEIAALTQKLNDANIRIEELGTQVTTLNTQVDSLNLGLDQEKSARTEAEMQAQQADAQLNMCLYAIGTKSELKEHKIIETGFLRRTKLLEGDYDRSYFTEGDKRSLTLIPLHAKKAEVLTNQPADSYEITTTAEGMKVLHITDPARFWQFTNYLVIQTDN